MYVVKDIKGFTDGLQLITKKDKWVQPSEFWDTSNILKAFDSTLYFYCAYSRKTEFFNIIYQR